MRTGEFRNQGGESMRLELPDEVVGYLILREDDSKAQSMCSTTSERLLMIEEQMGQLLDEIRELTQSIKQLNLEPLEQRSEVLARALGEDRDRFYNRLAELESQVTRQTELIEEINETTRERDYLVEKLFEEREQLKTRWIFEEFLEAPASKIIDLRGTLLKAKSDLSGNGKNLIEVIDRILMKILEGWGITESWESSENFDPAFQRAILKEVTSRRDDGRVLEVVEPAYYRNGKILHEQIVAVGKYKET